MSVRIVTSPIFSKITLAPTITNDGFKLESDSTLTANVEYRFHEREHKRIDEAMTKMSETFNAIVSMFDFQSIPEEQWGGFASWAAYIAVEKGFKTIHDLAEEQPHGLDFTFRDPADHTVIRLSEDSERPAGEHSVAYTGLGAAATEVYEQEGLDLLFSRIIYTPVQTDDTRFKLMSDIGVSVKGTLCEQYLDEHRRIDIANKETSDIFESIVEAADLGNLPANQRREILRRAAYTSAAAGYELVGASKDFPIGLWFTFKDAEDQTESEVLEGAGPLQDKDLSYKGLRDVVTEIHSQEGSNVTWT